MRHPTITVLVGALALAFVVPQISSAETLISEAEAKLPQAPDTGMATRGITRGPGIEIVSPAPGAHDLKSPLPLKIKFIVRNSVPIDTANVKLTYLRVPSVDLTDRVKSYLTKDGIDMAQADVPPGNHLIRIDVRDAEGRSTATTLTLSVAPK
jgi:hypothetical protein